MRNFFLFCAFALTFSANAQVIETKNVTPYTFNVPVKFERITTALTGKKIFLQGHRGDQMAIFVSDGKGDWWDVSKGQNKLYNNVVQIVSGRDSLLYLVPKDGALNYWAIYESGASGFWYWERKEYYSPKEKYTFGMDRSGGDLYIGGDFTFPNKQKEGPYYVLQKSNYSKKESDWNWSPVWSKKTPADVTARFASGDMRQITGTGRNEIYVLLQDRTSPKNSIVKWDGKIWSLINEQPDTIRNMVIDNNGVLYANTDAATPEGKDCIMRWDGSVWSVMPIEGFKRRTPKLMVRDEKGIVYLGGMAPSGKEFFVMESDGAGFRYFGAAPAPMHDMAARNGDVYLIGNGNDGGVYRVPRGGLVTANTLKRPGQKKDMYVQQVYDFYAWYGEGYLEATQQAYEDFEAWSKQPNKENALIAQNTIKSMLKSGFWGQESRLMRALSDSLHTGENLFFDYLSDMIGGQYGFYDYAVEVLESAQSMYYNGSDHQRYMERLNKLYKTGHEMGANIKTALDAYQKRNPELIQREVIANDTKTVKPDESTLALYEAYKQFSKEHEPLKRESDRTFNNILSGATSIGQVNDAVYKFGNAGSSEASVLYAINSKIGSVYNVKLQPEATSFHSAFSMYIESRTQLYSSRREAANKLTRSDLSAETRKGYMNGASRQETNARKAEDRFNKALSVFKQKFVLD